MFSMIQSVLLLILTLLAVLCTGLDIREPPSVREPPEDKIPDEYIRRGGTFQLPCEATGIPEPIYIWMHNGKELDLNDTKIRRLEKGTIEISDFEKHPGDEGEYQCVASNKYGKSLSQMFKIILATLTATGMNEVTPHVGYVGFGTMIPRTTPKTVFNSVPEPSYVWKTVSRVNDSSPRVLIRDKRILQDLEGNLYFTSLQASDAFENERFYKIEVYNHVVDATLGSYIRFKVFSIRPNNQLDSGKRLHQPPSLMYPKSSKLKLDVLEGTEMKIQCIYGGYPDISITWSKPTKSLATLEESGTRLVLKKMTKEAAGEYECTGSNIEGARSISTITVEMHTIPKFTVDGRPSKQTLIEGEMATFTCQTTEDTNPQATVEWMINGVLVQDRFPGPRTEVTTIKNGKKLTIIELNWGEDIKVVQCKATNKYKTLYINAPLNILKKTTLIEKPVDQTMDTTTTQVVFVCRATSDPSTPPTVRWLRDGKTLSYYDDPRMLVDQNNGTLTLNLDGLDEDQKTAYSGKYKCTANNGHRTVAHTAMLKYRNKGSSGRPPKFQWPIALIVISSSVAAIATVVCIIRKRKMLCNFTNLRGSEQLELPQPRIKTDQDEANSTAEPYLNCVQGPYVMIDPNDIETPSPLDQQAIQNEEDDSRVNKNEKLPRRQKKPPAPVPRAEYNSTSPTRHSYLLVVGDEPMPAADEPTYLQPCELCVEKACQCADRTTVQLPDVLQQTFGDAPQFLPVDRKSFSFQASTSKTTAV